MSSPTFNISSRAVDHWKDPDNIAKYEELLNNLPTLEDYEKMPVQEQTKLFELYTNAIDYRTKTDPEFKLWMEDFDPSYATDEKDDDLKNEFTFKDEVNKYLTDSKTEYNLKYGKDGIKFDGVPGLKFETEYQDNTSVDLISNSESLNYTYQIQEDGSIKKVYKDEDGGLLENEWKNLNLPGVLERDWVRGVPKTVLEIFEWMTSGYITAPEGTFIGDPFGDVGLSEDFQSARDYWNKTHMVKWGSHFEGAFHDEAIEDFFSMMRKKGIPIYEEDGYGIELGANFTVLYRKNPEELKQILEDSSIISVLEDAQEFVMKNPITVDSWEDIKPTYINTIVGAIPDLAIQIGASYSNPVYGMMYAGMITGSDSYQTAKPYIEKGNLTVNEAHELSVLVASASLLWNYGPSKLYSNAFKQSAKDEFEKRLFDKIFQKGLHKKISMETLKSGLVEAIQETGDEVTNLYAESTYRDDLTWAEGEQRIKLSAVSGFVLGSGANITLNHLNQKQKTAYYKELVETEKFLLPKNLSIDDNGILTVDLDKNNFESDEQYEQVKTRYDSIVKNIDIEKLRKEYPNTPLNLLVFNHLFNNNPLFENDDIEYDAPLITQIMTAEQLIRANYDPDNLKWKKVEIKEGDENYVEGERRFKVWTLGSNIYDDTGGRIILTEGATQDVFVEEMVELTYKRLETENPELKQRIDRWISQTEKILNGKGPTGIELFSKFYTFNYLGYADTEFDLGEITMMPKDILDGMDNIIGQQSDGSNLSFLFNGDIEKTLKLNVDEQVDETVEPIEETTEEIVEPIEEVIEEPIETKDVEEGETFRLTPQQEEFFKDSKVRDDNGELIKVYHGTTEDFDNFDRGGWFAISPEISNIYTRFDIEGESDLLKPKSFPAYINLKNPLNFNEAFDDGSNFTTWEEFSDFLESKTGEKPPKPSEAEYIDENSALWEYTNLITDFRSGYPPLRDWIMSFGYDGLVMNEGDKTYYAFKPEQVKSQFNPEPTSDPRMSFRLTPQQEEFFKDSKVRDSGGNPYAEMLGLEKNYLLKVYHGTRNDFEEFKFLDSKTTNEHYAGDLGFWFTSEPKYKSTEYDEGNAEYMASEWANKFKYDEFVEGANVIPAYLNLKNPIEIYGDDLMNTPLKQQLIDIIKNKYNKDVKSGKEIREALLSEGIDGVHIIESFTDGNVFRDDWVAFKPEQIKSQFNPEPTSDPRISYRNVPADVTNNILNDFTNESQSLSMLNILNSEDQETFANNNAIGTFLNENSNKIQEEYGIDLTYDPKKGYTEDQIKVISDVITREALNEVLNNENNAGAWYSTNMENSIRLLGDIYPEILDDMDSRSTFVLGLAITSNGQAPSSNLKYAMEVYDFYKENGRFPETVEEFDSAGSVSPSMRQGFVKFNALVEEYGLDATISFLNTNFSVSELKDLGYTVTGENVDQEIPGSIIFGPKIGGAFYPNLQGSYGFVTMDRWFMRTIGRITGELTKTDWSSQLKRFRKAMLGSKAQLSNYNVDVELFKTDDEYAISIASLVKNVYAKGSFQKKTELNMSSNNLMKQFDLVDSPRGGNQRASLRTIMSLATDNINQYILDNNIEFPTLHPADVQALIWFPEKRLYDKLRTSKSILKETSYEDETIAILKSRGYDDKRISDILNTTKGFSTEGGSFNVEGEFDQSEGIRRNYRLEPVDPDELTPEMIDEQAKRERLDNIYDEIPTDSDPEKKPLNIGLEIDRTIRPISSVLKSINPILKEKLRKYEFKVHTKTRDRRAVVNNFYTSDKYKKMDKKDQHILDLAFKNADGDKINEIVSKYDLTDEYNSIRTVLEEIHTEAVANGYEIGYLEDYVPRLLVNRDALLKEILQIDPEYNTKIQQAVNLKSEELGRELEVDEIEHIIDMTLRGYNTLDGGKPANIKERKIMEINNILNKYYAHSSESLLKYIDIMTNGIEKRTFLGQSDTEGGFSEYVRKVADEYGLTVDEEALITEVLKARFGTHQGGSLVPVVKNVTYIATMGNPISAITQLGDLVWSYNEAGIWGTWKSAFGEKKITIEDLGIDKIGQEFETKGLSGKAVEKIFKLVGIAKIDRLGKETLINSVFSKYQKEAKSGKLSKKFEEDIENYFGETTLEQMDQLVKDIADGNITDDVRYLLFNKLLDHQPVADSEMPIRYLRSPDGRLFYQLKTFTIKQLDVTRNLITDKIINAKTNKERIAGMRDFTRLLSMWILAGATKDMIKDLILGRPIDTDWIPWENDYVIENVLQFAGASRYHIYVGKNEGLDGFINKFIQPPSVSVGAEILEDIYKLTPFDDSLTRKRMEGMLEEEIEEFLGDEQREDYFNILNRIPVFGKIAFWRSEPGRIKIINQQLRDFKSILNKRELDDHEIEEYQYWLDEAFEYDIITWPSYENRLEQMYK